MKRRERQPEATDEPPEYLREFGPDRYRQTAVQALRDHPGDVWCAAMHVWRAWQYEGQAWQAERGVVRGVKAWRRQLGQGRPPMAWVCEEFALTVNDESTPCPPDCRTHAGQRLR
ncbi:hypothetical protein [Streptomyces fungicidicus]|uniref:Uncharacterized protein n=1 Tax=Streptomyces fungicidicus TaxID=68203 RepID=A0A494UWI8_9ACTN|nr:hypothetical protein [Streptomyces fungicidicus]AYL34834.1 hypothetical protein CNQ36_04980 [Streptomyces fungicidicus]